MEIAVAFALMMNLFPMAGFLELHLRLRLGAADELQLIRFIMLHKPVATGSFGANSPPTTYLCPPNFVVPKNFFY